MSPKFLLPTPEDNVAIATRRLEAGEPLDIGGKPIPASQVVLPGHRICVVPISQGQPLLSWGLPFGTALLDIAPGDYICNAKAREVLLMRHPDEYGSSLPVNFVDRDTVAERILPSAPEYGRNQVDTLDGLTFDGFFRGQRRGWGTRNYLALIGVTSGTRRVVLDAARELQRRFPATADFDGVVPVIHTEGGGITTPNNLPLLLRTLAGFALNPNAGAAILVNEAGSLVSDTALTAAIHAACATPDEYLIRQHDVRSMQHLADVTAICDLGATLAAALMAQRRQPAPLSGLRLGLQCGGSDAFSGVTANQVLGKAVHQLIRRGGTANLAETDELIGAEQYVLQRVADQATFDAFLATQQRFKDYAQAHGNTAEGNVSGGNIYRGLYNITLKSLGAARKRDPATSIDQVIDYGVPMSTPGYYFMDSPGNDLESIAGQVASGANMILFTTGNGSITNFPFVPTIKIVTTNERFALLASDMDFNAGKVLDGASMEDVAEALFGSVLAVAGGERTLGERTGQYQTQIWRNWHIPAGRTRPPAPDPGATGMPLLALPAGAAMLPRVDGQRFALVLPTSLCSGQVAEQIAARINNRPDRDAALPRVIALPHTEGCGVSGGNAEDMLRDTLLGYATHPLVDTCVFLEHGCEKTHNDYFRAALRERGLDPGRFHWASIQLEGGIAAVTKHVEGIFGAPHATPVGTPSATHVGLACSAPIGATAAGMLGRAVRALLDRGIGIVLSSNDPLLMQPAFAIALNLDRVAPTLGYSQQIKRPGLHVMDSSSTDWLEIATGLGAAGCTCLITAPSGRAWQPHRFIPTLQIGLHGQADGALDLEAERQDQGDVQALLRLVLQTLGGGYRPRVQPMPNVGFQISRGRFGVSL